MEKEQITAIFDQQAATYDQKWSRLAPINSALHLLTSAVAMLDVLRQRAEEHGISARCAFHAGYLDTLPNEAPFDAATAFLVSQFILDPQARSMFFMGIAERLHPEGMLISSDLSADLSGDADSMSLLEVWVRMMRDSGSISLPEEIERMREAYMRDLAVLPPQKTRDIIRAGGFDSPVLFFQAGMIHAWYAKRLNQSRASADSR